MPSDGFRSIRSGLPSMIYKGYLSLSLLSSGYLSAASKLAMNIFACRCFEMRVDQATILIKDSCARNIEFRLSICGGCFFGLDIRIGYICICKREIAPKKLSVQLNRKNACYLDHY